MIINLVSFQKVALWENCVEYILFMEKFVTATESDFRNEGEIEHKKMVAHSWWQLTSWEIHWLLQVWFNKTYFPHDKICRKKWIDGVIWGIHLYIRYLKGLNIRLGWQSCHIRIAFLTAKSKVTVDQKQQMTLLLKSMTCSLYFKGRNKK